MEHLQIASDFLKYTQQHVFLTGKAGTGKTTFLQNLKASSKKNMVILAPTGVAAINAGGVTIHSFFQLHFGTFIPHYHTQWGNSSQLIMNTQQLLGRLKYNSNKRKIIQELELIIIDEISMVRADIIDAIDTILQHVRKKAGVPFGGVQMLFIGDLYQLPPVLREEEKHILLEHYRSGYFFDALAFKNEQPICIALQKIFRQQDEDFIHVLNNIRSGKCTEYDIELLHEHYNPLYTPYREDKVITLTTHNTIVNSINANELSKIPEKSFTLQADIDGEFPEHLYPIESSLEFKVSAQVMFIKNDKGEQRKYFNGKLATIEAIDLANNQIVVSFENESETYVLEPEVWNNIRFRFDEEKNAVEEEVIGTFKQFPIKLAWAVTIHKSQGLTFDKAIIDAGKAFAPGQVYVALSRLRSLDGLILKSKINPESIAVDPIVQAYSEEQLGEDELLRVLEFAKVAYIEQQLGEAYNFNNILTGYQSLDRTYNAMAYYNDAAVTEKRMNFQEHLFEVTQTGLQFQNQVAQIVFKGRKHYPTLKERLEKAQQWFQNKLTNHVLKAYEELHFEANKKTKSKKFFKDLNYLKRDLLYKIQLIDQSLFYINGLLQEIPPGILIAEAGKLFDFNTFAQQLLAAQDAVSPDTSGAKLSSQEVTYQMYTDGKSIETIATERQLVISTVMSHLIQYVEIGKLDVKLFIATQQLQDVVKCIEKHPQYSLSELKSELGTSYSYTDIKLAMAYLKYNDNAKI